ETASIFLPSVPQLLDLATAIERERDHVLGAPRDSDGLEEAMLEAANTEGRASESLIDEFEWQALASSADFGRIVYDGDEFGFAAFTGSDDELDFLSVPAVLTPEELREALRHRQARQGKRAEARPAERPQALYRTRA